MAELVPRSVAVVTGASGGIGADLARLCAAGGRDVVLVARSVDRMTALAAELERKHGVTCTVLGVDLSEPDAAPTLAADLAERGIEVDVLINNAGYAMSGRFVETSPSIELAMIQLNVVALTRLTKLLLPGMVRRGRGRVLNVASTAAFLPGPLMAVYYATKAYVLSLSEALAEEVAGTGVTVTCLCPGATRTGFAAVAGMGDSKLFNGPGVMDSATVARVGYDAMIAGRRLVIPGIANKIGMQSLRFAPRALAAKIARAVNGAR
jgi:short-subunit dehydrogenase